MTLYLYKTGTVSPVLTIENAVSYTDRQAVTEDGTVYGPFAEGYELSGKVDCSETLRSAWRVANPTEDTRMEALETIVAEVETLLAAMLFGGEGV